MVDRWQYNGKTYYAWSEMCCSEVNGNTRTGIEPKDHPPHTWESEYTVFGPYLCWGRPYQGPKHRRRPSHKGEGDNETLSKL